MKYLNYTFCLVLFLTLTAFDVSRPELIKSEKVVVKHRVQLCEYTESVPVDEVELMRQIGGVSVKKEGDKRIYLTAPYQNEDEATKAFNDIVNMGFALAEQVVEVNDEIIPVQEYHQNSDWSDRTNENPGVIRIWK